MPLLNQPKNAFLIALTSSLFIGCGGGGGIKSELSTHNFHAQARADIQYGLSASKKIREGFAVRATLDSSTAEATQALVGDSAIQTNGQRFRTWELGEFDIEHKVSLQTANLELVHDLDLGGITSGKLGVNIAAGLQLTRYNLQSRFLDQFIEHKDQEINGSARLELYYPISHNITLQGSLGYALGDYSDRKVELHYALSDTLVLTWGYRRWIMGESSSLTGDRCIARFERSVKNDSDQPSSFRTEYEFNERGCTDSGIKMSAQGANFGVSLTF